MKRRAECTRNNPEPLCTPPIRGSLRGPRREKKREVWISLFPRSRGARRILCIFLWLARARKYFQKGNTNPNVCLYRWRGNRL